MPTQNRLIQLGEEIDAIVDTAVSAPNLTEPDVRRVLRFISQVIQVVEQAFQDVLTLLIDIKLLKPGDLHSPRLDELRRSVELLTARSYYRDAAEICSRLKHLGENFDQFIRPSVASLPHFSDWRGVFGLIEHREGRIIQLVEESAAEISKLLSQIDNGNLDTARQTASRRVEELRSLLKELRDLNSRILGFSGSAGFLEMTTDRTALQREVKILVDKRDQSVTHGHRVSVGSSATFHGDFVVATSIQDSFNKAQSASDPALRDLLQNLCKQVEQLLSQIPPETRKSVSQDLSTFVAEASSDKPRRQWYELSANGLIEAAKACAGMASPIVTTVKTVLSLLA
jgi:hypothetical protein